MNRQNIHTKYANIKIKCLEIRGKNHATHRTRKHQRH